MITETSLQAWDELRHSARLTRLQLTTLQALQKHGPCTARELSRAAGLPDQIQKRLSELVGAGVAIRAGERTCAVTGRAATVWQAKGSRGGAGPICPEAEGGVSGPASIPATERYAKDPERGTLYRGGAKVGRCGCGTVNWGPCNKEQSCGQEHCCAPGHACPEVLQ